MSNHELHSDGPVAYPGGKDGWYIAWCGCDTGRLWWGPTEAQALKPAREHKRTKDKADEQATLNALPADHWRRVVTQWLDGPWSFEARDDLVALLPDHEESVTLTYRELAAIVNTVRINAKQR